MKNKSKPWNNSQGWGVWRGRCVFQQEAKGLKVRRLFAPLPPRCSILTRWRTEAEKDVEHPFPLLYWVEASYEPH